jgi:hypothetical protein
MTTACSAPREKGDGGDTSIGNEDYIGDSGNGAGIDGGADSISEERVWIDGGNALCPSGILQGDYTITDSGDLRGLEGVECLEGTLRIGYSTLTDLDGLESLKSVGALVVENNLSITNLEGLRSLSIITGDSYITLPPNAGINVTGGNRDEQVASSIHNNPALEDLNGLRSLASVGGAFYITDNQDLVDVGGLHNMLFVDALIVERNTSLRNLDGLNGLSQITGEAYRHETLYAPPGTCLGGHCTLPGSRLLWRKITCSISENPALNDLQGLNGLTSLECSLTIASNSSLTNLNGLNKVSKISGLIIRDNLRLREMDGLTNIAEARFLEITGNPALTSLVALANLDSIEYDMVISGNANLPTCDAEALRDKIGVDDIRGDVLICDNLPDECGSQPCQ